VLPIALAIIMLSLGSGLTTADFVRIAARPKAFAIGAVSQFILVPIAANTIILTFGLTGAIAVGTMLLVLCPSGVTSNMISKLAKGDVALSVSLTAVVSLLSILTVPVLATRSVTHFMDAQGPDVSITSLAIAMFMITTLPVLSGVTIRHFTSGFANKAEPILSMIATLLFAVIVTAALAGNWSLFVENLTTLAPALIMLMPFSCCWVWALWRGLLASHGILAKPSASKQGSKTRPSVSQWPPSSRANWSGSALGRCPLRSTASPCISSQSLLSLGTAPARQSLFSFWP